MTDQHHGETRADGAPADRVHELRRLRLQGDISAATDLSGIVVVGEYLFLGADEGHELQVLAAGTQPGDWCLQRKITLASHDQEVDIEGITFGDGHLYVAGSHSARRRLLKPEASVRRNRERLLEIRQGDSRCRLYRLALDTASGKLGTPDHIDLRKRLRKDPLLKTFVGVPGKENGIDIEGIAYRDGELYLGFRGPVLRGNYVPLMVLDFDHPKRYRLDFVRLDGQGIRDLVALENGFLIIGGPVNDAPGPFCLWWWDGEDQIPGKSRDVRPAEMLGEITTAGGAKAEGLALLDERDGRAELIVLYETEASSQAVQMQVELPA